MEKEITIVLPMPNEYAKRVGWIIDAMVCLAILSGVTITYGIVFKNLVFVVGILLMLIISGITMSLLRNIQKTLEHTYKIIETLTDGVTTEEETSVEDKTDEV